MPLPEQTQEEALVKKAIVEFKRCAEDPEYFIENYCFYINTRKTSDQIGKMKLWPIQKRLLPELLKFQDIFIEKSREMGVSWLVMAFQLHQTLFTEAFSSLNLSRKEDEVEDSGKTYHSLFGRLDFMYRRLPTFLKLRIENPHLTFKCPATNSVIKGESANENAGRDTQYKFIFVDEAAHIDRDVFREMWKGVRNSTDALCINSTPPKNIDNKYIELKDMANSGFKKMRFFWTEHPEKDETWFKKRTASMTPDEIAQEILISYDKVKESRSYPEFNRAIHKSNHKIYLNPKSTLYMSFDFGLGGEPIGFYQKDRWNRLFLLYMYEKSNLLTYEHVKNITHILADLGFKGSAKDIVCFGDPAGKKRARTTKTTVIDEYKDFGFNIKTRFCDFDEKRRTVKKFLKSEVEVEGRRSPQFVVSGENCEQFCRAMEHCRLNKQGTDHIDDWTTHKVNSFEYIITNLFPITKAAGILVSLDPETVEKNNEQEKILAVSRRGSGLIFGLNTRFGRRI